MVCTEQQSPGQTGARRQPELESFRRPAGRRQPEGFRRLQGHLCQPENQGTNPYSERALLIVRIFEDPPHQASIDKFRNAHDEFSYPHEHIYATAYVAEGPLECLPGFV